MLFSHRVLALGGLPVAEAKSPVVDAAESAMLVNRKALTMFLSGCGSGRRRFVWRFFRGAFGLSLLGYRRCGGGCWLGGPRADAWVAGSGLLQFTERTVGAFVDPMET